MRLSQCHTDQRPLSHFRGRFVVLAGGLFRLVTVVVSTLTTTLISAATPSVTPPPVASVQPAESETSDWKFARIAPWARTWAITCVRFGKLKRTLLSFVARLVRRSVQRRILHSPHDAWGSSCITSICCTTYNVVTHAQCKPTTNRKPAAIHIIRECWKHVATNWYRISPQQVLHKQTWYRLSVCNECA